MPKIKRVIQKIETVRETGFEQQFWPIVIALCILGGFVYGASLALLDGFWLWISLIAVPIVICTLIAVLHMIDNRILRRSIQLAMILSVIFHVALLIFLNFTNIFHRGPQPGNVVSNTERQSIIVNQRVDVDVQQFREVTREPIPTEETEEIEQQQAAVTDRQPQPVPVAQPQNMPQAAVNKRREKADSIPRREQSLSRMSRRQTNIQPQSGTATERRETRSTETTLEATKTNVSRQGRASTPASPVADSPQSKPNPGESQIVRKRSTTKTDLPANSAKQPSANRRQRSENPATRPEPSTTVKVDDPQQQKSKQSDVSMDSPAKAEIQQQKLATVSQQKTVPAAQHEMVVVPSATMHRNERSRSASRQPAESPTRPARMARGNSSVEPRTEPATASSKAKVESPSSPAAASRKQAVANELKPSETTVTQQQSTHSVTASSQQPQLARAEVMKNRKPDRAVARRPDRTQQPKVAQSTTSLPHRSESQNAVSARTETRSRAEQQQSVVKSATAQPNPTSSQVARSTSPTRSSNISRAPAPEVSLSPAAATAMTAPKRANSRAPSVSPTEAATQQPRRSTQVAANARSNTSVENPSRSQADSADGSTSPNPVAVSIARRNSGVAGRGSSSNLMSEAPSADRPSVNASNSRRREQATRSTPADNALAASSRSRSPRSAADQPVPNSSRAANNAPDAKLAGKRNPATLSANASPATIDSASQATESTVSADVGTAQVDIGPVKIVSEAGSGRASGGGQRNPDSPQPAQPVRHDRAGSGSLQSLLSKIEMEDVAAPEATGGGQPMDNKNDLAATSKVSVQRGGEQPSTAGPSRAMAEGPTTDMNSAANISRLIASRAEPAETVPGEQTDGGGTPNKESDSRLIRSQLAGGPDTSSIALIDNLMQQAPRSMANGRTLIADVAGIDAPSVKTARVNRGNDVMQKLAAGMTGSESPTANENFAGTSKSTRRNNSDPKVAAESGSARSADRLDRNARALEVSTNISADDAREMAQLMGGAAGDAKPAMLAAADTGLQSAQQTTQQGSSAALAASPTGGPETTEVSVRPRKTGNKRQSDNEQIAASDAPSSGGTMQRSEMRGEIATDSRAELSEMEIPVSETGSGSVVSGQFNMLADIGLARREANAGEAMELDADPGPGGAGLFDAARSGLNSRRAREETGPLQAFSTTRFFRVESGAIPTMNKIAIFAREAFDSRGKPGMQASGEPTTEEAIDMGLEYLIGVQREDGRWILEHEADEAISMHSDTAATGLALLAFQGAGYNHREYKYAEALKDAIGWLVDQQQKDGNLYVSSDEDSNAACELYSHGIAALALCEAYGMTQDPSLKEPAQRALNYIAASQDKELGGWRYAPGRGADTSVTGWMMMALKSGRLAGLETDNDTMRKIRSWLDAARTTNETYLYRYNPYAEDEGKIKRRHGRNPTQCMTAVGLLMRLYTGWNRDNIDMIKGADYLLTQLPDDSTTQLRDTYYWYYATQVLRHVGGERWKTWNDRLHPLLVDSQIAEGQFAGSWNPMGPVPDRWGPHGGRLYVTAMNLLSLEVDYRLLPLYEDTVE